jgi:hypothetical protein
MGPAHASRGVEVDELMQMRPRTENQFEIS